MSDQNKLGGANPGTSNAPGERKSANMILMKVTGTPEAPSLAAAAEQLGVGVVDIDEQYGIVALDREKGLYAVRVRSDRLSGITSDPYRGPYSDPEISTFGIPRRDDRS